MAKDGNSTQPGLTPKCFWLMHQFADIATGNQTTSNSSLLSDKYRLPFDFTAEEFKEEGAVKTVTLEDYHMNRQMKLTEFDRSMRLNSDDQSCRNKPQFRGGIEESKVDLRPFQHQKTDKVLISWDKTPT